MKTLVIGASGHVGSYLVKELVAREQNALVTLDHVSHSPCCTPRKAQILLGVEIQHSIMDIFYEYIAATRIC